MLTMADFPQALSVNTTSTPHSNPAAWPLLSPSRLTEVKTMAQTDRSGEAESRAGLPSRNLSGCTLVLPHSWAQHSTPHRKTKQNAIWLSPSCTTPDGLSADLVWEAFRKGFLLVGKAAVHPRSSSLSERPPPPWAGGQKPFTGGSRNTCLRPGVDPSKEGCCHQGDMRPGLLSLSWH